jgi:hypothetical protein
VESGLSQEVQRLRTRFNDSIKDTVSRIDRCEAKASELQLQTSDVAQFSERLAASSREHLQHVSSQLTAADTRLSHDVRVAAGMFEAGREEVLRSLRALEKSVGESLADVKKEQSGLHERVDAVAKGMEEGNQEGQAKAAAGTQALAEEVAGLQGSVRGLKESLAAKMHDANRLIAANDLKAREALEQAGGQLTVAMESAQSSLALNTQRLADMERIARDDAARAQRCKEAAQSAHRASHVTCHMSHVTCYTPQVTHHRSISETQAELTALIGLGHSETKIKVCVTVGSRLFFVLPFHHNWHLPFRHNWQVAALETAVAQLDQKIAATGAAVAAAAAAADAPDVKKQQQQAQAVSSSPSSQSDALRAVSVAERALQTASALEVRVKKIEAGGQGGVPVGLVDKRIAGMEEGLKRVKQQQADDVS